MDIKLLIERFRKPVLITVGLVAFYALAGFVLLPKYLQSKIPELIETETGRKASLERIEFNPFLLELRVQGFAMQEQDLQTFVSFKEFFTNVQVWSSIRHLALVLADLRLTEPFVRIEELKEGRYNFSDLLSDEVEEQPAEESEGIFPVMIHKIALVDGKFATINALKDEPINKVIDNINLSLEQFSTLPEKDADLGFSMALNGGSTLQWHGDFSVNPIFSEGKVSIDGLQFTDIWSLFLQDAMDFKWASGTQSVAFNYVLSYPDDKLIFTLSEGLLETKDLTFIGKEDPAEFLTIPSLIMSGLNFDLNKQVVDIEKITATGADFKLWYEPSGELNYQAAFIGNESELHEEIKKGVQEQLEEELPWIINIHDIALNTATINYSDKRNKEPVLLNVKALDLGIKNASLSVAEVLQLTANQGYLNLHELILKTPKEGELIKVPEVKISEIGLNLLDKNVKIQSVSTSDALIKSWLAKNGEINYQSLFAPTNKAPKAKKTSTKKEGTQESPWLLELAELKVSNYAVQFKDYTPAKPVAMNLSAMNFTLTDYNTRQGTRLPISFSSRFNKQGKIKISGHSVLEPFKADLDIAISQIGIDSFEPYINQGARLNVVGGTFNTQGKLAVSQAKQADLKLQYKGQIDIKKLHTRDKVLRQDFLKWQQLTLAGLDFNLQPGKLRIKSINLVKPYARVTIKEDNTTNIADIIVAEKSTKKAKPKPKKKEKTASPFVYKIDSFKISKGESDFADYSLILPFVVHMNDLKGGVKNISSNPKATTKVDLKGKAFDLSPVKIQGEFDAKLDNLDVAMSFKRFPLPFLSPYMVEFSGDKIEKGKMSLDLRYKINGKQLTASNDLVIDQFELGDKVENPDAVNLPIGLAAILLRDKDGRITINMPLKGNTDDPEFSVAGLVFDVFVNLLVKVAASPFTAIGSFLNSDADFSVVTFAAGDAEINVEQAKKLDELASALAQKSELSLDVRGMAYTNQDWPAMKDTALRDQLKQIYADELKKAGKEKRAEYIKLDEEEYQRLLADLFIKTFPDLAKRSIFGTPKLIDPEMGEFYAVASEKLKAKIKPDNNKLTLLALTRGRNTARHIVQQGGIEQSRIFVLDGKVQENAENNELNTELSLKAQ